MVHIDDIYPAEKSTDSKFLSYPYTFLGSFTFLSSAWLTNRKLITMNIVTKGTDLKNSYQSRFF